MPPAGFQPAIPASERLQTHALDRSATGIGTFEYSYLTKLCVQLLFLPLESYLLLKQRYKRWTVIMPPARLVPSVCNVTVPFRFNQP